MKPSYVVFECNRTVELCHAARAAGFDSWVPMRFERRMVKKKKSEPAVRTDFWYPAMSGYIFVLGDQWASFRRWASIQYSVRVMTEYFGPGGDSGPKRSALMRACEVSLDELKRMDEVLRKDYQDELARWELPPTEASVEEVEPEPDPVDYVVEQKVQVNFGPFKGMHATVKKIDRHEVRLEIATRYVSMPKNWVA